MNASSIQNIPNIGTLNQLCKPWNSNFQLHNTKWTYVHEISDVPQIGIDKMKCEGECVML